MKEIQVKFEGTSPLLLHNNRMVDPLDIYSKAMKTLTSKRNKTDADQLEISRIEWEAGLYFDVDGFIALPTANIEAMLLKAAKRAKNGPKIKSGVSVDGLHCRIKFADDKTNLKESPQTPDDVPSESIDMLFEKYKDRRPAKPKGQGTIIRTRPRFDKWCISCSILYEEDVIDERTLLETIQSGGRFEGLGDYREKYGHFIPTVTK